MCVCVCVCVRVRACVRACVCVCVSAGALCHVTVIGAAEWLTCWVITMTTMTSLSARRGTVQRERDRGTWCVYTFIIHPGAGRASCMTLQVMMGLT